MNTEAIDELLAAAEVEAANNFPTEKQQARVAQACNEHDLISTQIGDMESQLARKKGRLKDLEEKIIPAILAETGIRRVDLTNGASVTVSKKVYAHIKEENREAAHDWLRANNSDDIIKNEFKAAFGKGEDQLAADFEALCSEKGVSFSRKEAIHPGTLAAFLKEQIERQNEDITLPEVPLALFGAHVVDVAKITMAKPTK